MPRLMFITGSLAHGGAERHAVALMNRLSERGHECHGVYVKDEPGLLDRLHLRGGGTMRCLDAARYLDRKALADFAAHVRRVGPEVVVAANPYALMYASLALRLAHRHAPLAVIYHSTRLLGAKERLKMLFYRPFFWGADCSVFVCEMQKRYCLRRGVLSRKNVVIHNGVDTDAFRDGGMAEGRDTLRRSLSFGDADYVIGMCGMLRPEKNHLQLVEAVAMLRRAGIPARALMIGDGPMRAAVEQRARALGVAGQIAITGIQQDVRSHVAACDAVALCSHTEAFSLAAIEAMALGRPVVHADVGGAAEMIAPGRNGFLFPSGDTRALVEKLAILADRAVSGKMGAQARLLVEARFSEKAMVDRYEQMLLELCQSNRTMAAAHRLHSRLRQ